MFTRIGLLSIALTWTLTPHVAHAQYRSGVPAVVIPPPPTVMAKPDIGAGFASAYQRAGRPRIAVFWNRELSDEINAQYESYDRTVTTTEDHRSGNADSTTTEAGTASTSSNDRLQKVTTDRAAGSRRIDAAESRSGTAESIAWRLESSFYHPLLAAGTRLVDRNMAMRSVSGGKVGTNPPDAVAIETSALLGKADLLMEVLMSPDADSPIGCRFRVTVKDVKSGRVVGLLSTRAIPPTDSHTRYVPGQGGFQKVTTRSTPNLEDFAQRLAEETMVQLTQSWNRGV